MKKSNSMRVSFSLLFLSLNITVGAATLPRQSYSVYSSLYEFNQDNVSMSYGTIIKGVNHVLAANNNSWGSMCVQEYGEKTMDCRTCCGDLLAEKPLDQQQEYANMHSDCLSICNTGLPLGGAPLDMPLWFIVPLCGLYVAVQSLNKERLTSKSI